MGRNPALPENYRWCSLGYHVQAGNKGNFMSVDFGLKEFAVKSEKDRFNYYRRFVHVKGRLDGLEKERAKGSYHGTRIRADKGGFYNE